MKKILFLFAALVMSVASAWAGVVAPATSFTGYSDAPEGGAWAANTQWFMIQNLHTNGTTKFYLSPTGNYLPQTLPTAANIDDYLWALVGDAENGFQLYNKAQGPELILWASGSTRGMSAEPTNSHVWDLYTSLAAGKYLFIEHGTEHNAFNNGGQEGRLVTWNSDGALYGWNHTALNPTETGDDGSNFIISGAEDFTVVVNGLVGEGGVVIAGENHGAGTVSTFGILADAAEPIFVEGYDVDLNVSGTTITVTYTEHVASFPDAGTYFVTFTGQASGRKNNLYNDLTQSDGYTLQAASQPNPLTNNFIWKAVCDGSTMTVVNGQGSTMKLKNGQSATNGATFNTLAYQAHNYGGNVRYYLMPQGVTLGGGHNCLNVASNGNYQNAAGIESLTSWSTTSGPNAGDNHWAVNVVDMTGLNEYTVSISGKDDVYVTYNGQYAANGGFFLAASIVEGDLTTPDYTGFDKTVTVTGTAITVEYVQAQPDWAGLEAIVAEAEACPYGDKLGQYSNPSFASELGEAQMMLTMHAGGTDASIEAVDEAISNLRTAINGLTLNMPKANTFLRIKGGVSGNYVAFTGTDGARVPQQADGTDAKTIIYYAEDGTIISYYNGHGMTGTHSQAAVATTKEKATFSASKYATGKYCIQSDYTGSKVWYDHETAVNRNSAENSANCSWVLEEVTSLPVSVSAAGYATLYAPVALTVPAEVEAYTLAFDGTYLQATQVNTIPANAGVVLKAGEGTYNFDVTTGAAGSSELVGSASTIATPENCCTLAIEDGNVGFYKYTGATVAGFKAYYVNASSSNFRVNFDQLTSIISAAKENGGQAIYDLQGRRVVNAKGLNIVNGKKVIR